MKQGNVTRTDLSKMNAGGEAIYAGALVAAGTWLASFARKALSAGGGYWLIDVPTCSRARGESPVIPGSLYWR